MSLPMNYSCSDEITAVKSVANDRWDCEKQITWKQN